MLSLVMDGKQYVDIKKKGYRYTTITQTVRYNVGAPKNGLSFERT